MRRPGICFANLSSGFFSYRPSSSMDQWLEPPEGPPLDQAPMVGDLFTTKAFGSVEWPLSDHFSRGQISILLERENM